jgi:hypothetical protein
MAMTNTRFLSYVSACRGFIMYKDDFTFTLRLISPSNMHRYHYPVTRISCIHRSHDVFSIGCIVKGNKKDKRNRDKRKEVPKGRKHSLLHILHSFKFRDSMRTRKKV